MTDFADYADPTAHAQAISVTGVPLLGNATLVKAESGVVITGGSSRTVGSFPVSQISYLWQSALKTVGSPAVPFVSIQLTWLDAASSETVATDTWISPVSNNLNAFLVSGQGPAKADSVQITVTNLDSSVSVTLGYGLFQTSMVYTRDDWRWPAFGLLLPAVPGFTLPSLPSDEAVLGLLDNVTIPAANQNVYLFGMHDGLVNIGYEISTGTAANLGLRLRPQPDSIYSAHNILYAATSPPSNFQVAASRAPLRLVVANAATTSMIMSLSIIRVP